VYVKSTTSFIFPIVSRVLLAGLAFSGTAASVAFAASFTVNTQSDTHDINPGDGLCVDGSGKCSLRAAIEESNHLPAFPQEVIALPSGTYKLTLGELNILNSLDLTGAGSDSTFIDGNDSSRVLAINGATKPIVHFSGVTIQNGNGGFVPGGGIYIDAGAYLALSDSVVSDNKSTEFGGGISNAGELQIFTSTIQDNCVSNSAVHGVPCNSTPLGSGGGQTESGGGIFNFSMGNVTIDESTISGNRATRGGGIRNGGGHLEITNSTISGNTANTRGGGIMNFGNTSIAYSTIAFNEANAILGGASEDSFGGGIYNVTDNGAMVSIGDTILAMNTDHRSRLDSNYAPDCFSKSPGNFTSFRGNLVGILNANCNMADEEWGDTRFDQVGTPQAPLDPRLGLLADNGGPTETHALGPDSPAIDRGTGATNCPKTDQRGETRPAGNDCDVGAFELASHQSLKMRGVVLVQNLGDEPLEDSHWAGTKGQSLRLEGFAIDFSPKARGLGLEYMCHLQGFGDTSWLTGGSSISFCGTRGQSRRLEGFAIRLTGDRSAQYDVYYGCHLQGIGDTGPVKNGEFCGTRGQSRRLEALVVWVFPTGNPPPQLPP
jgi:CSLREA domain-containing protein